MNWELLAAILFTVGVWVGLGALAWAIYLAVT
jgi:hypothetical protein